MGLTETTAPAIEPVSLAEQKLHMRVDDSDENALITTQIAAARMAAERFTQRSFIETTWAETFDAFPAIIRPPRSPLSSTASDVVITYVDIDGTTQTLSSALYTIDATNEPARIIPAFGESWPSTRGHINDVTVTFVAGYGTVSTDVPDAIIAAVKLLAADLYEFREAQAERRIMENPTVKALLWFYRLVEFPQ